MVVGWGEVDGLSYSGGSKARTLSEGWGEEMSHENNPTTTMLLL